MIRFYPMNIRHGRFDRILFNTIIKLNGNYSEIIQTDYRSNHSLAGRTSLKKKPPRFPGSDSCNQTNEGLSIRQRLTSFLTQVFLLLSMIIIYTLPLKFLRSICISSAPEKQRPLLSHIFSPLRSKTDRLYKMLPGMLQFNMNKPSAECCAMSKGSRFIVCWFKSTWCYCNISFTVVASPFETTFTK
jgi:hypothetical protein